MKKIICCNVVLAVFLFVYGNQTISAQTEKRIQFAKGKSSATVSGMTGTSGIYYNLRVGKYDQITVTLTPKSGIGVKIELGEGKVLLREEHGGTFTIYTEDTGGDISIFLGSTNCKSKAYNLKVTVKPLTQ